MLAEALLAGASGQLRNMATIGGNLLQRTRCAYFQDVTKPCNKREPGSGCPAREGEHRNLAILGHSEHCVATHPSDMAVALAAFDAAVRVVGPAGAREIPLADLHRLPGDAPAARHRARAGGELITAVDLPPPAARRQVALPQGARARLVRVRARLGRRGARRGGRRRVARRADRARRRRAPAVAGRRGRGGAARRPARAPRRSRPRPTPSWRQPSRCATTPTRCPGAERRSCGRSRSSRHERRRAARSAPPSSGSRAATRSPARRATPSSMRRRASPTPRSCTSPVARGMVRGIDAESALALPGVLAVLSARERPEPPGRRGRAGRAAVAAASPTGARSSPPSSPRRSRRPARPRSSSASTTTPRRTTSSCVPTTPASTGRTRSTRTSPPTREDGDVDAALRGGRGRGRRDLHDPGRAQQPDGAARHGRRLGGRTS